MSTVRLFVKPHIILVPAMLLAACKSPTTPTPPRDATALMLNSDRDHVVGQGESVSYTRSSAQFEAQVESAGAGIGVTVLASQGSARQWNLLFEAPLGERLVPGTFTFARSAERGVPGFDLFATPGVRRCGVVSGQLTIQEASYTANTVNRFRATFEHRCSNNPATLRGELVIDNTAR